MFTFDAIEKSLYNGVSPDRVPDTIKNRFSMVFGYDSLDNRLHVEISQRQIREMTSWLFLKISKIWTCMMSVCGDCSFHFKNV